MSYKTASVSMIMLGTAFMLFAATGKSLFEYAPTVGWLGNLFCFLLAILFRKAAQRRGEVR
ncbi:hypothetical protein GTO91_16680 [Heliobacterium undosum]|uniref:Uncharacterized protein n=1 Tax=Heliomicrobium undosum TaxID=121734 RepID=A0A845LCE9_9FIRM|nr:hypothetical protein [Heliomicrobium undosum]MZP31338.1 hypothetical protein [Heliomicrobium undosum]